MPSRNDAASSADGLARLADTAAANANDTPILPWVVTSRNMQMKNAASEERRAAEDQVGFLVRRVTSRPHASAS